MNVVIHVPMVLRVGQLLMLHIAAIFVLVDFIGHSASFTIVVSCTAMNNSVTEIHAEAQSNMSTSYPLNPLEMNMSHCTTKPTK